MKKCGMSVAVLFIWRELLALWKFYLHWDPVDYSPDSIKANGNVPIDFNGQKVHSVMFILISYLDWSFKNNVTNQLKAFKLVDSLIRNLYTVDEWLKRSSSKFGLLLKVLTLKWFLPLSSANLFRNKWLMDCGHQFLQNLY